MLSFGEVQGVQGAKFVNDTELNFDGGQLIKTEGTSVVIID